MDDFIDSLICTKTDKIPPEYDWFGGLIGDWDIDFCNNKNGTITKGEWIFRRVLVGTGIADLFIVPSREIVKQNPKIESEHGMTVRMFNKKENSYDAFYGCEEYTKNIRFVKEGEKIVGTLLDNSSRKWVFVEIKPDWFHWQNVTVMDDGTIKVNADVYATRKTK